MVLQSRILKGLTDEVTRVHVTSVLRRSGEVGVRRNRGYGRKQEQREEENEEDRELD